LPSYTKLKPLAEVFVAVVIGKIPAQRALIEFFAREVEERSGQ
jgi:hypothetical protein